MFYIKIFLNPIQYRRISWCLEKNNNKYNGISDLFSFICYKINHLKITKEYRIFFEEKEIVQEILDCFLKELVINYFRSSAATNSKPSYLTDEEYFVLNFRDFLCVNELESFFNGVELYNREITYYRNNQFWNGKNHFTEYAKTYHKLYYFTQIFCENNSNILKACPYLKFGSEEIKENIDNNYIEIIVR